MWVGCGKLGVDGGFGEEELRVSCRRPLPTRKPRVAHPSLLDFIFFKGKNFACAHPRYPENTSELANRYPSTARSLAAFIRYLCLAYSSRFHYDFQSLSCGQQEEFEKFGKIIKVCTHASLIFLSSLSLSLSLSLYRVH